MREIVLDTETTGLDPRDGHKVVEIGAIELDNHLPTGEVFHVYLNPQRPMPHEAFAIHGLSDEFLADKPLFDVIADQFLKFIDGAVLVIHNAAFDMKFLNAELVHSGREPLPAEQAMDTLEIAKRKHSGGSNSLDALCRRYGIDNSGRVKHGALLDSELLAEVYLELIGGRQPNLMLVGSDTATQSADTVQHKIAPRATALEPRVSDEERKAHEALIDEIGDGALWRHLS